jgi:biotin carboxyl carrier protein
MIYNVSINGTSHRLELRREPGGQQNHWTCHVDGRDMEVDAVPVRADVLSLRIGNQAYEVKCERIAGELHLWVGTRPLTVEIHDLRSLRGRASTVDDRSPRKLIAPMPGKVVRVLVKSGTEVEAGAGVLVVEAMKMQNEIKSTKKGTIQRILVSEGAAVNAGDVLAIVE